MPLGTGSGPHKCRASTLPTSLTVFLGLKSIENQISGFQFDLQTKKNSLSSFFLREPYFPKCSSGSKKPPRKMSPGQPRKPHPLLPNRLTRNWTRLLSQKQHSSEVRGEKVHFLLSFTESPFSGWAKTSPWRAAKCCELAMTPGLSM